MENTNEILNETENENIENINEEKTVSEEKNDTDNGETASFDSSFTVESEEGEKIEGNNTFYFNDLSQEDNESTFEKLGFTPVKPEKNNEKMSKGFKLFCGIMALVILVTFSCIGGFFFGRNSVSTKNSKSISLNLASKPKDTDESTAAEVYEMVNKSVVGIEVYDSEGNTAQASGVVYSKDGYIVTNDHIYAEISAPSFKVYDYEGNIYDAEYIAGDSISDLALLKVKSAKFDVPEFGDSNDIVCGENVVAIGRPSGARTDSSITKGIISLTKRRMSTTSSYTATLIQTDSAINPGSSGGALVNMYGQVVGITSSKLAGVNYDDTGFAIPTVTMKRVISQLSKNGKVEDRAKLGITYTEITPVIADINNLSTTGLYIASVSDDSDLAGKVTQGDIITHVKGTEITNSEILLDIIENSYAGDKIELTIMSSSGTSKDYIVTLKANVGESSYHLSGSTDDSTQKGDGKKSYGDSNGNSDGTFDFPNGE